MKSGRSALFCSDTFVELKANLLATLNQGVFNRGMFRRLSERSANYCLGVISTCTRRVEAHHSIEQRHIELDSMRIEDHPQSCADSIQSWKHNSR